MSVLEAPEKYKKQSSHFNSDALHLTMVPTLQLLSCIKNSGIFSYVLHDPAGPPPYQDYKGDQEAGQPIFFLCIVLKMFARVLKNVSRRWDCLAVMKSFISDSKL